MSEPKTQTTFGNSLFTIRELSSASAFCDALVKKLGMDPQEAGMFRYISPPKGHKDHMSQAEAREALFPKKKDPRQTTTIMVNLGTRALDIVANILYGTQHTEYKAQKQAEQEERDSKPKRERRDKAVVAFETKRKEFIRSLREQLGVGPKGRVTSDVLEKYEEKLQAWDAKHNPELKEKSAKSTAKPKQTSKTKAETSTPKPKPPKVEVKAETKVEAKEPAKPKTPKVEAKEKTPKPKTPKAPVAEKAPAEPVPVAQEPKEELPVQVQEPALATA